MSHRLREPLVRALDVDEGELFEVDGLLDLKDLWDVCASRASPSCATSRGRR